MENKKKNEKIIEIINLPIHLKLVPCYIVFQLQPSWYESQTMVQQSKMFQKQFIFTFHIYPINPREGRHSATTFYYKNFAKQNFQKNNAQFGVDNVCAEINQINNNRQKIYERHQDHYFFYF